MLCVGQHCKSGWPTWSCCEISVGKSFDLTRNSRSHGLLLKWKDFVSENPQNSGKCDRTFIHSIYFSGFSCKRSRWTFLDDWNVFFFFFFLMQYQIKEFELLKLKMFAPFIRHHFVFLRCFWVQAHVLCERLLSVNNCKLNHRPLRHVLLSGHVSL